MQSTGSNGSIHLRLPGEIGQLVKRVVLPENPGNPIVVCEFEGGHRSLFDVQKGLFMNRPGGVDLPSRETLKAFGALVQRFRENLKAEPCLHGGEHRVDGLPVEEFAVCG